MMANRPNDSDSGKSSEAQEDVRPSKARLVSNQESPLQEDEEQSHYLDHPAATTIRSGALITPEELNEVKTALETQDKIVLALEQDNKRLHVEYRAMVAKLRDTERANSRLEAKVVLQNTATGGAAVTSSADNNPIPSSVSEGAAQQIEQLNLKIRELHGQNDHLKVQAAELRVEVDVLKKEKKDLERRFDPQQVTQAEIEAREARVEMQKAKSQYTEELDDMLRKVAWYVDHQETNRAQEDLIRDQQQTINDLRVRVLELEGDRKVGPGAPPSEKDKRIRHLERRLVELENSLREQNPNSIPELIRACRPSPDESKRNTVLLGRIQNLETELDEQQTHAARSLDRLRVESDGLRAQYQQRMEKLEDDMKAKLLNAQSRKVKEIEKQLAETKKYYISKVKDLEQINLALRRPSGVSGSRTPKNKAPSPQMCEDVAEEGKRDAESSESGMKPSGTSSTGSSSVAAATQLAAFQQLHMQQQMELMRVLRERDEMALRLREAEQQLRRVEEHDSFNKSELDACRKERDEMMQTATQLRHQSTVFEQRIELLNADHRRGLDSMRQQFLSEISEKEDKHKKELEALRDAQRAFDFFAPPSSSTKSFLVGDQEERTSPSNEVRQYLKLVAERLRQIEQQQVTKDLDHKHKVEEIRKIAQHEVLVERQKMDLILQEKNNEIHHFRLQLDNLLADIAHLHRQGQVGEIETVCSRSPGKPG